MADNAEPSDPFGDFVGLVAGPLAAGIRSVEQMRHAADEFVRGVENFNRTMENLNATVERVNRLLDDIEEPTRALLPQVTRSVKAVDDLTQKFAQLPIDPSELASAIVELSRRLAPLAQMAESATGMFGLRIPGFGGGQPAAEPASSPPPPKQASPSASKKVATKKSSSATRAKRTTSKRTPAKKSAAKRT